MIKDNLISEDKRDIVTHILVIRLSAMGDVAMTVPVLRVLRETYPTIKITVLTRKFFEPIFASIANINICYADVEGRHKGIIGLARLSKELRQLGITQVADLHNVLRSNILKQFFNFRKINVVQIDKGRAEKKALTRPVNKIFKQLKTTHQRYADVFAGLAYPIDLKKHKFPLKNKLTPNVSELTKNCSKKWIGIAPFAQHEGKTYPLELMKEVIRKLDTEGNFDIFLFGGGKKEIAILSSIEKNSLHAINVAGRLSFEDELILISNLRLMVSMDSGNAHLAAIYGIPTITIWGLTHPFTGFYPFNQPIERAILPDVNKYHQIPTSIYGNKIPDGYEKVMYTINPKYIIQAISNELFAKIK